MSNYYLFHMLPGTFLYLGKGEVYGFPVNPEPLYGTRPITFSSPQASNRKSSAIGQFFNMKYSEIGRYNNPPNNIKSAISLLKSKKDPIILSLHKQNGMDAKIINIEALGYLLLSSSPLLFTSKPAEFKETLCTFLMRYPPTRRLTRSIHKEPTHIISEVEAVIPTQNMRFQKLSFEKKRISMMLLILDEFVSKIIPYQASDLKVFLEDYTDFKQGVYCSKRFQPRGKIIVTSEGRKNLFAGYTSFSSSEGAAVYFMNEEECCILLGSLDKIGDGVKNVAEQHGVTGNGNQAIIDNTKQQNEENFNKIKNQNNEQRVEVENNLLYQIANQQNQGEQQNLKAQVNKVEGERFTNNRRMKKFTDLTGFEIGRKNKLSGPGNDDGESSADDNASTEPKTQEEGNPTSGDGGDKEPLQIAKQFPPKAKEEESNE